MWWDYFKVWGEENVDEYFNTALSTIFNRFDWSSTIELDFDSNHDLLSIAH